MLAWPIELHHARQTRMPTAFFIFGPPLPGKRDGTTLDDALVTIVARLLSYSITKMANLYMSAFFFTDTELRLG